jgi:hypothetical protein
MHLIQIGSAGPTPRAAEDPGRCRQGRGPRGQPGRSGPTASRACAGAWAWRVARAHGAGQWRGLGWHPDTASPPGGLGLAGPAPAQAVAACRWQRGAWRLAVRRAVPRPGGSLLPGVAEAPGQRRPDPDRYGRTARELRASSVRTQPTPGYRQPRSSPGAAGSRSVWPYRPLAPAAAWAWRPAMRSAWQQAGRQLRWR